MGYLLKRAGQGAIVLWAAFTVAFILLQALPGDAIMNRFLNPDLGLTSEQISQLRQSYGVGAPLWQQYFHSAWAFLTGDLGNSLEDGTPVRLLIEGALPSTAVLAAFGLLFAILLALAVAFLSALAPFAWLRNLLQSLPSLFIAVPVFWLGIMLIQILSFKLRLVSIINPGPVEGLVLPVATLAIPLSAPLAQVLVRSIDETLLSPFITVAAAKGASRVRLLVHEVARNAVLPAVTVAGLLFGELIGSAIVTETVYGRVGLGRITEAAVKAQDAPVVEAVVLISAIVFVVVNLIVDLLYPLLDARLRTRAAAI
ncbi:MAG: binding--dependent transport system inner rane component family protein [Rhodoglobus sp.]|nr:binding--dependent transport system inner rane component family protein [Rhodoglobus sp.]